MEEKIDYIPYYLLPKLKCVDSLKMERQNVERGENNN